MCIDCVKGSLLKSGLNTKDVNPKLSVGVCIWRGPAPWFEDVFSPPLNWKNESFLVILSLKLILPSLLDWILIEAVWLDGGVNVGGGINSALVLSLIKEEVYLSFKFDIEAEDKDSVLSYNNEWVRASPHFP